MVMLARRRADAGARGLYLHVRRLRYLAVLFRAAIESARGMRSGGGSGDDDADDDERGEDDEVETTTEHDAASDCGDEEDEEEDGLPAVAPLGPIVRHGGEKRA